MLNGYAQRQRLKRSTADDRFLREVRAEACQQVGVQLCRVREALPADYKSRKSSDAFAKGRKEMPDVSMETLADIAKSPRPMFFYIGADEPLATHGKEKRFYTDKPGIGLEAVARFVLDALATQSASEVR